MRRPDPASDLLHALIAAGLNRLMVNLGDRSPGVAPDLKWENQKTKDNKSSLSQIASWFSLSRGVMQI